MKAAIGAGAILSMAACAAAVPPGPTAAELALGERIYRQCHSCHALEPGRNTPAGPTLYAIVGRPIAAEPSFDYSPALRWLAAEHGRWTSELLDGFMADPAAVAPGTEMGYPGLDNPAERRALIAWLRRPRSSN